jgi:hypothetical protein
VVVRSFRRHLRTTEQGDFLLVLIEYDDNFRYEVLNCSL